MRIKHMPPIFFGLAILATAEGPVAAQAGTLVGQVRAAAGVMPAEDLSVAVDTSTCAASGAKSVPDPRLVIGKDRELADVVVTIRGVPDAPPHPSEGEPVLDQQACEFIPHVVIVALGQSLRVKNSDSILHTFRTIGTENRKVNKAQTGGKQDAFTFETPEILTAECDVHYWMSAVVVVAADAFTAVSGSAGEFEIDGLPAGSYEVEFWHQVLGSKAAAVEIGPDGGRVDVELGPVATTRPAPPQN